MRDAANASEWEGWEDITPPRSDDPGHVELVRKLAHEAMMDISFHEVALDSAFKAERVYQALGRQIIQLLGYPEGVTIRQPSKAMVDEWTK